MQIKAFETEARKMHRKIISLLILFFLSSFHFSHSLIESLPLSEQHQGTNINPSHKYISYSFPEMYSNYYIGYRLCANQEETSLSWKHRQKTTQKPNNMIDNFFFPPQNASKFNFSFFLTSPNTSPVPSWHFWPWGIFSFLQPGAKGSAALSNPDKQTPARGWLLSDNKLTVIRLQSILIKSRSEVVSEPVTHQHRGQSCWLWKVG